MKIALESTDILVEIQGVPARKWEGYTVDGLPIIAYVALIGVKADQNVQEIRNELIELKVNPKL